MRRETRDRRERGERRGTTRKTRHDETRLEPSCWFLAAHRKGLRRDPASTARLLNTTEQISTALQEGETGIASIIYRTSMAKYRQVAAETGNRHYRHRVLGRTGLDRFVQHRSGKEDGLGSTRRDGSSREDVKGCGGMLGMEKDGEGRRSEPRQQVSTSNVSFVSPGMRSRGKITAARLLSTTHI